MSVLHHSKTVVSNRTEWEMGFEEKSGWPFWCSGTSWLWTKLARDIISSLRSSCVTSAWSQTSVLLCKCSVLCKFWLSDGFYHGWQNNQMFYGLAMWLHLLGKNVREHEWDRRSCTGCVARCRRVTDKVQQAGKYTEHAGRHTLRSHWFRACIIWLTSSIRANWQQI